MDPLAGDYSGLVAAIVRFLNRKLEPKSAPCGCLLPAPTRRPIHYDGAIWSSGNLVDKALLRKAGLRECMAWEYCSSEQTLYIRVR